MIGLGTFHKTETKKEKKRGTKNCLDELKTHDILFFNYLN